MADDRPRSTPSTVAILELLGRRWALRVLWELREDPATFQALQGRCDSMSTSVLTTRLGELREAGLLTRDETGRYCLTAHGRTLLEQLRWVDDWSRQWAGSVDDAVRRRDRHLGDS
jgi:DNA-binding HxlR family transcriptional regulator